MKIIQHLNNEQGYILPIVLLLIIVMLTMISGMSTLVVSDVNQSKWWQDRTAAYYIAESGVNHALYQIKENNVLPRFNNNFPNGTPSYDSRQLGYDFGDSSRFFQVWVKSVSNEVYIITAKGYSKNMSKIVEQEIHLSPLQQPQVVFPRDIVEATQGRPKYLSTYDFTHVIQVNTAVLPTFSATNSLSLNNNESRTITGNLNYTSISMGNNSQLTINGPATINVAGNFSAGNNSTIKTNGAVTINVKGNFLLSNNGSATALSSNSIININGDFTLDNNSTLSITGPSSVTVNGNIDLNNNNTIRTSGKVTLIANKSVSMAQNCSINPDSGNSGDRLDIFVARGLTINNNAIAGSNADPRKLVFWLGSSFTDNVSVSNNADLNCGIYAANRNISLGNNANAIALVGKTVSLGNNARVTYDARMADITFPDEQPTQQTRTWLNGTTSER